MKLKIPYLIVGAGLSCGLVAGCGSDHTGAGLQPTPPVTTIDLDTAAVLSIVQTRTSETAPPFAVDNGAIALTPVGDETSLPLIVDP